MAEGLAREGFDIDLRHGEAREDALVHVFLKARVEHKCDGKAKKTGNLFVEYRQKGRPSGIAVTTAEWWAFEFDDATWLIVPTQKLKHLARRAYQEGRVTQGGDHNHYDGVLLPLDWLVRPLRPAP